MEIFGADIAGINGHLIRFEAVKQEGGGGVALLGLAQRVVREGLSRAAHAITTLEGDWGIEGSGYTISMRPAETTKVSSGLDLPLAITLLHARVLQNLDKLTAAIEKLDSKIDSMHDRDGKDELRRRILALRAAKITERETAIKYQRRLSSNKSKYLLIGQLSITSGQIETPEHGMLEMLAAAKPGFCIIAPEDSEVHAALTAERVQGVTAYKARTLQEVWSIILGAANPRKARVQGVVEKKRITGYVPDIKDIKGCSRAKLAMTVALAGGHNILLVGPQGQGKTMLAQAGLRLMPKLKSSEVFEVNKIYSARGDLAGNELVVDRPFQLAPSNITPPALLGGGIPPRPGVVSLAHCGVLFFDEINMCSSSLVEHLRGPLNDRQVSVARNRGMVRFPCSFILVAAMNPCSCGWDQHYECPECDEILFGGRSTCPAHPYVKPRRKCTCSRHSIAAFRQKLSGPLLDRIDLKVMVSAFDREDSGGPTHATSTVQRLIQQARDVQESRYRRAGATFNCNADVPDLSQLADTDKEATGLLRKVSKKYKIETLRKQTKLVLVARTVADLAGARAISEPHMEKAAELMGINDPYIGELA